MSIRMQKLLSILCVLALLVGLLPTALAVEVTGEEVTEEAVGVMPEPELVQVPEADEATEAAEAVEAPVAEAGEPETAEVSAAGAAKVWSWDTKDEAAFFTTTGGQTKDANTTDSFEGLTSTGMKFQSSVSVSFTVPDGETGTLTIRAASQSTDGRKSGIKLDGTLLPLTPTKGQVDTLTQEVKAGKHTLTPGEKESTLYFLKYAPSHTHEWDSGTETKPASCTEKGEMTYTCTDPACPGDGTKTEEIPMEAHTEVVIEAVPATCVTDGKTAGKKCSVCGTVLEEPQVVKATGQHNYENGECTVCHLEQNHTHTLEQEGTVTQEPTCTEPGMKLFKCVKFDQCGYKEEKQYAGALGHDKVQHAAQAATCTEDGWNAYETCSRCDFTDRVLIPAKGHKDEDGDRVCDVCTKPISKPLNNAGGWFESLYAVLPSFKDADVEKVTYSGTMSGELTGEDFEYLVRDTADGVRVDIPGIPAGTYTLAVTADGVVYEATGIEVLEHDRSGYAHYQYTDGVGAYRDDGILKENAIVLYVTEENKNTVAVESMDGTRVVGIGNILNTHGRDVGGGVNSKGGKPNTNQDILRKLAADGTPLVVRIVGSVSSAHPNPTIDGISAYDSIDYGGSVGDNGNMVRMKGGKDITIEGIGPDAVMDGWGMHFMCQSTDYPLGYGKSFEVRNLSFRNVPEDCIGLEGIQEGSTLTAPVERGWVHNCAFYKPSISPCAESDKNGGDGACDFKRGNYFTMDYCYYEGYHKTNLVGSSDTSLQYHITWHHNYWKDCESRGPLGRQANMHIYNCIYENQISYAMNPRANCYIFSEYNVLEGCKNPVQVRSGAVKSYHDSFISCFDDNQATVVTDKSQKVSSGNKYENFDTDATLSYIPSGDYKLDQSLAEARANIMAYTGPMKAKVITPDEVESAVGQDRTPKAAVVLPYDKAMNSTNVSSAKGTFDNVVFNANSVSGSEVRLGKTAEGKDIVFKVDEPVDITITDGGATTPCVLVSAGGDLLLEGSGTVPNVPAGIYYIQPGALSKGVYKEAKITHLTIEKTKDTTPPHEHSYTGWEQTVAPTCTRTGVEMGTCSCDETQTREIGKVDHDYVGGACKWCGLMEGTLNGGEVGGETVAVTGLTLEPADTTLELEEGMSQRFIATVSPANATKKTVNWTTDNAAVATVAKNGTITAKGAGTATITATTVDGGFTKSVTVSVVGILTDTYNFTASKDNPIQGDMSENLVLVADATKWGTGSFFTNNGAKNNWQAKNFKGGDKSVGFLLLATGAGSSLDFTIPAGTTARKVTLNFSSTSSSNTSAIALKGPDGKLVSGSGGLIASVHGTGATPVTYENLGAGTYQILVPANITPQDVGQDTESFASTAADPNARGARLVSVSVNTAKRSDGQEIVAVESVTLDRTTASLEVGKDLTLHATVAPSNASNKNVTWTSSNTAVATVAAGAVVARSQGTATITATAGGKTATCAVTVTAATQTETTKVTKITVVDEQDKSAGSVTADADNPVTLKLSVVVEPDDADDKSVTWTSDAAAKGVSVATDGMVTVASTAVDCTATITATAKDGSGKSGTYTLSVTAAHAPVDPTCEHANTELRGKTEPTCTQEGYTGDTYCTDCSGLLQKGQAIAKLAHNFVDGECTVCHTKQPTAPVGGGGGGGSITVNTTTQTETLPDGTKVTTTISGNTEKIAATKPDGTKVTLDVKADGSATGTVTVPDGTKATVTTDKNGQTAAQVTVPAKVDATSVTIPVKDATTGTVPVIVKSDGTEEIVRMSALDELGVVVKLEESAQLKLVNNAKKFEDMPGHWAEKNVDFVSARELFNGTDATHFTPSGAMTRGMMATVLYRLDGEHKGNVAKSFADVGDGTWYTDAVEWAADKAIVTGYNDTTFAPDDNVTREQLAVMIYRYAKAVGLVKGGETAKLDYADADSVSSWAKDAVSWLTANGILTGKPGNLVDPAGNASRAEVATVLERFVELAAK